MNKEYALKLLKEKINGQMDIYHEDIIFNPDKLENIYKYNLKKRSYSFFKDFYRNNGYKSPRKHRCFKGTDITVMEIYLTIQLELNIEKKFILLDKLLDIGKTL